MKRTVGALLLIVTTCTNSVTSVPTPFLDAKGNSSFQVDKADGRLQTWELIEKYGYESETHTVITADGYELTVHRIRNTLQHPAKVVILLMHGLLGSSSDWLLIGPGNALAYLLADRGYDVWLGNARGNRYSRRHQKWAPKLHAFWNFSWHEIGFYDLPAMIDYALQMSGANKLHYIGHSQGTTSFFVMCSSRPEYNEKITLMQALAPVAFMEHMKSPVLRFLENFLDEIKIITKLFGIDEFLPNSLALHLLSRVICPTTTVHNLCVNIIFMLAGYDPEQTDPKMIPILLGHIPAGAATKQLVHYAQLIRSKQFRQFDHGKLKNKFVYGASEPPSYNLSAISAPTVFYYGMNDLLAAPIDVKRLANSVSNLQDNVQVDYDRFNHLDFLLANDVHKLLYDRVITRIELSAQ